MRPLDLAGKLGAPFDEPAHDEGVHGFIQPFCSRSHAVNSAMATAATAKAMEKTACLKMITILSSSKRRSHSLITGQSEQIEGLRLLDWIVPVVR